MYRPNALQEVRVSSDGKDDLDSASAAFDTSYSLSSSKDGSDNGVKFAN